MIRAANRQLLLRRAVRKGTVPNMQRLGERVLWQRARDYVARYQPKVVAITGTAGTQLAKQALGELAGQAFAVRVSNEPSPTTAAVAQSMLGVRSAAARHGWMGLLRGSRMKELAEDEPNLIIVEKAAHKPGEIDFLAQQLPYAMAIVTGVASRSLHLFQSKENIAHECASLVAALPSDGIAILNADDALVHEMRHHTKATVITFGTSEAADVRLLRSTRLPTRGLAVEVRVSGRSLQFSMPQIAGFHQVTSIVAAIAALHGLGINPDAAVKVLHALTPSAGHGRMLSGQGGALLIDDTYDTTPETMMANLHLLRTLPVRRRIAVLGDIANLGGENIRWHNRLGRAAAESAHVFIAVGQQMRTAGAEALRMSHGPDTHHFDAAKDVGKWLGGYLTAEDAVLIAGSRAVHMEEVVRRLLANPEQDGHLLVQPQTRRA